MTASQTALLREQRAIVRALQDEIESGPLSDRAGGLRAQLEEELERLRAMELRCGDGRPDHEPVRDVAA